MAKLRQLYKPDIILTHDSKKLCKLIEGFEKKLGQKKGKNRKWFRYYCESHATFDKRKIWRRFLKNLKEIAFVWVGPHVIRYHPHHHHHPPPTERIPVDFLFREKFFQKLTTSQNTLIIKWRHRLPERENIKLSKFEGISHVKKNIVVNYGKRSFKVIKNDNDTFFFRGGRKWGEGRRDHVKVLVRTEGTDKNPGANFNNNNNDNNSSSSSTVNDAHVVNFFSFGAF